MAFTNEEIIAAIDTVVEGREDFVYQPKDAAVGDYSYTDCFVGKVCGVLDPEIQKDLIEWEKCEDPTFGRLEFKVSGGDHEEEAERIRSRFTRRQIEILNYGQRDQDAGVRWGIVAEQVKDDLSK